MIITQECKVCHEARPLADFQHKNGKPRMRTCAECYKAKRRADRFGTRKETAENHLGLRQCRYCTSILPLEQFPFSHKTKQWRRRECADCCDTRVKGWLTNNRERHLTNCGRYYHRLRDRVLAGYGGRCACCGISEPDFLTVDHVNQDGAARRKSKEHSGGFVLFKWIIANGFPSSLRLLCANCNMGRERHGGVCPHERGSSTIPKGSTSQAIGDGSASHPYPAFAGMLVGDEIVRTLQ